MINNQSNAKEISKIAIMIALIFLATYSIKVPSFNGYTHMGDSMIFIGVLILGTKKGALAGGIGAALADLLGGYMQWVVPTFFIKFGMAFIMGMIVYKVLKHIKFNWIIGACLGGAFQVLGYAVAGYLLYGIGAFAEIPGNILQTISGILMASVIIAVLSKSHVLAKLRSI